MMGPVDAGGGVGEGVERLLEQDWGVAHYLGVLLLFFFLVEVGTGVLLMAYYRPVPAEAYASLWWTINNVRLGAEVRQIHARGADLLVGLLAAHLVALFWHKAYATGSQFGWASGVLMLVVVLAFAFTGLLLPWNQVGYWLAERAREVIDTIPVGGHLVLQILWGGSDITDETLLRFYVFHVGLLPWAMVLLAIMHVILVWRHRLNGTAAGLRQGSPLVAIIALNAFILVLLSTGVLLTLAVLAAVPVGVHADALRPLELLSVPWYFGGARLIFQWLSPLGGILALLGLLVLLVSIPFMSGGSQAGARHRVITVAGIVLLMAIVAAGVLCQ